jgi:hypothetical protein
MVKAGADRLMKNHAQPVALIVFDTAGKAAGYARPGDENDSVVGRDIIRALETLAREIKACVIGIDHFGKVAEVGTRGTSSKEGDADFVLALLGDRDLSGAVANPRLAIRKRRTGETGLEIPFRTEVVEIGRDLSDCPITTLTIVWTPSTAPGAKSTASGWPKATRLLRQVLMNVLVDHGKDMRPFPDGPTVRAADIEIVREEFYRSYAADGDAVAKQSARRQAFRRAVHDAQGRGNVGVREIGGDFIWLAQAPASGAYRGGRGD